MTQEEQSIKYVMKYEESQRRNPVDVSKKRTFGYDIESRNRFIEVKSRPGKTLQPFITLHNHLLRSIGKGLANYYIYIVYDMGKEPKLVIIPPEIIFKNLETDVKLFIRQKVYNKLKFHKLKKLNKGLKK
ncbi:MAG: DUF3883 domain-containing protein [Patescibacteria group bacterium]